MSELAKRAKIYREIEAARRRPLITYVTSPRRGIKAMMDVDAIPELLDQLEALPAGTQAVDILAVSNGGDPTVAWRLMSLLRERVEHVAVLVPQAAFSAATLLALGANEIVMHPNGNLGPVDPQIEVVRTKPGTGENERIHFGFEELAGFLEFARNKVGLTDQEHLRQVFSGFCSEAGSISVGFAARSARLSLSMGEKLLRMHMRDAADEQKARTIAENLNKSFFHHGYPVSRSEAKSIGLPIANPDPRIEGLIWGVWTSFEAELRARIPFDLVAEVARSSSGPSLLGPVKQFNVPASLSQQAAAGFVQAAMSQSVVDIDPVEYEVILAAIESLRVASRAVSRGKVLASRLPDLRLSINPVTTFLGWEPVDLAAEQQPVVSAALEESES